LGRINCWNSGEARSGSFPVFTGGKKNAYVIVETKGAAVKLGKAVVVQKGV
jgi:hypothetical protein